MINMGFLWGMIHLKLIVLMTVYSTRYTKKALNCIFSVGESYVC